MNMIIDLAPPLILAAINLVAGLIGALPGIISPIFSQLSSLIGSGMIDKNRSVNL